MEEQAKQERLQARVEVWSAEKLQQAYPFLCYMRLHQSVCQAGVALAAVDVEGSRVQIRRIIRSFGASAAKGEKEARATAARWF